MNQQPQNGDAEFIATATFRLCHKPAAAETITYHLSVGTSPTKTEIDILSALGENGRTSFCTFHEERESCVVSRPLGDLIIIWHPEKIAGSNFCLHVHARQLRVSDEEVRAAEKEWQGVGEVAGSGVETEVAKGAEAESSNTGKNKAARRKSGSSELPGDSVTVRLSFLQDEDSVLDPAVWRGVDISVPRTARVESLPTLMMADVRTLVKQDKRLFAMLQAGSSKIIVNPSLQFKDYRDRYVNFELGKLLVETFADLFSAASEERSVDVAVEMLGRDAETTPKKPADAVEPFVCDVSAMFRLGAVQQRAASASTKASGIAHEMIIVGVFDDTAGLLLGTVPIFSVNSLLIGDCYVGATTIDFKETHEWAEKYADATSIEDLAALVRAHRKDKPKPALRLPVRPSFSFRRFNPLEHGLGVIRWPSVGVHLTVRCVSMLPASYSSDDGGLIVFPALRHTRYALESVDNVDSVKMMIREEMRGQGKDGRTCGCLFEEGMMGKWEMVLWVLPQMEGTATLYRWVEGGAAQFLRPGDKGTMDGRLYVEAHVLEVEGPVSGRVEAADEMEEGSSLFVS
ncbi:hypothetical protein B0A55_07700 [Friedmanniomyces simplex]|uniref:Uncharacterized protein n=1 Tax=Friedmanniomyces simplex TaxID=329884 RepID=A0A4U0XE46_9PEZI|nr:hypothetical protein B0A55_07700 [Friedmanniomyces simplex]